MKTMKTKSIWAIEDGCYSDYHIVGVFSSEEKAQKIKSIVGGEVVEWNLDPGINEINKGLSIFNIIMNYSGNIERLTKEDICMYNLSNNGLHVWERTKAPAYQGKKVNDAVCGSVWAKDQKHAIKIANEFRTQNIAENKMFLAN